MPYLVLVAEFLPPPKPMMTKRATKAAVLDMSASPSGSSRIH
jgi:hypothetical protein